MELRQAQIRLFEQFAHLYDSGVALGEALDLVRHGLGMPLSDELADVIDDIYHGNSLTDALERREGLFSAEILGIIRAGETRGELGEAARAAAKGLRSGVVESAPASEVDLDEWLGSLGDARVVHLGPEPGFQLRVEGELQPGGEADVAGLVPALTERAGIGASEGTGAFLWRNRLIRVARAGPLVVLHVSGEPGPEPEQARVWREGEPSLLLVEGGRGSDTDAVLRSILAGFHAVAGVDFPVPEAFPMPSIEIALECDPDVICHGRLMRRRDAELLSIAVDRGIHAIAAVARADRFADVPHSRLTVEA